MKSCFGHFLFALTLVVAGVSVTIAQNNNDEGTVIPETYEIEWDFLQYPDMKVSELDELSFNYLRFTHDVWVYPSGNCADETGKFKISDVPPTKYRFREEDASPTGKDWFFVCDKGNHCEAGMNLKVTVFSQRVLYPTAAPTEKPNSEGGSPPTDDGSEGDDGDDGDDGDNSGDGAFDQRTVSTVAVATLALLLGFAVGV